MDTLVIGIDGGEWSVIDPLLENGALPNITTLIENGTRADLDSIQPPVSPPAWNSIQTGMNPGKHGIYDFNSFNEHYARHTVNASDRRATPFWKVFNDHGVETGLFKIPFTYPPDSVDGFMVSGFPTPEGVDDFVIPEDLSGEVGPVSSLFEDSTYQANGNYSAYKDNIIQVANQQTETLLDILEQRDPEFLMTVYDGADRIQHFFWKYVDENHPRYEYDPELSSAFRDYYKAVDRGIGRLLEQTNDPLNVMIISDHGFDKLSHDIYIERWLESKGFLTRNTQSSYARIRTRALGSILKVFWEAAGALNLQPTVRSILPEGWFARGEELRSDRFRDMKWSETTAFFSTLSGQSIYVNSEDRFEEGTVSSDQYDKVIDSLRSSLGELRHPQTNDPLIRNVFQKNDIFHGWATEEAPDLVVETKTGYTLRGGKSNSLIQPSRQNRNDRSGDHRRSGILVACGPDIEDGTLDSPEIEDIAPTVLYLHKCPVPKLMDGVVLKGLFTQEFRENHKIERTNEYGETAKGARKWTEKEEAELEDRLSDMGYME